MENKILDTMSGLLIQRHETIAVAESVTSGGIMAQLSLAKNATDFFQGGLVAYNLGQKTRQLHVDPIEAEHTNCVSDRIVQTMALNVAVQFCATWGIAVTGYAAPVPLLKIKECFALYCFVYKGEIICTKRIDTKMKGLERNQKFFTKKIVDDLGAYLEKLSPASLPVKVHKQ